MPSPPERCPNCSRVKLGPLALLHACGAPLVQQCPHVPCTRLLRFPEGSSFQRPQPDERYIPEQKDLRKGIWKSGKKKTKPQEEQVGRAPTLRTGRKSPNGGVALGPVWRAFCRFTWVREVA